MKSNWSSDFGHAETGNEAKKRMVYFKVISGLILKLSKKTVFEQKFAFSQVVLCFFLDRIFFLNVFPNPFIVHSRLWFYLFEPDLPFSLVVLCSHVAF